MTRDDLELLAAQYGPVAARHLDAIAALPDPWPPNAYGILAGVARLAIGLGLRLRATTPYDATDLDDLIAGTPRTAPTLPAAMGALRDAVAGPLPAPGPARCAWASALALAGADLYAFTAGPVT